MPILDLGTIIGPQGIQGVPGPQGVQGVQGDPTEVNGKTGASITLYPRDIGAGVPRNLLRNWYFRNPVNQRGVSGTVSAQGYFIDGWKLTSGTVTLTGDGLQLNGTMVQLLECEVGQPTTASCLTTQGVIAASYSDATRTFTVSASGATIVACKLELGAQQTLCYENGDTRSLYEIPEYAQELRRCQRYLYRLPSGVYFRCGYRTAKSLVFNIPTPTWMYNTVSLDTANVAVSPFGSNTETAGLRYIVNAEQGGFVEVTAQKPNAQNPDTLDDHGLTDATLRTKAVAYLNAEL